MRPLRRTKTFGQGTGVPLDRNAKVRIQTFARAWSARNRQPGRPGSRAALDVLQALLWGFHNAHTGRCFPSYEAIAERARCARSTVAGALKALEWAGFLTWHHRIARVRERCRDLFGRDGWRWRVIRTSNSYVFRDPLCCKSDSRTGTHNPEILKQGLPIGRSSPSPHSAIECALDHLRTVVALRSSIGGDADRAIGGPT